MHIQTPVAPCSIVPGTVQFERFLTNRFLPRLFSHDYCRAEFNVYAYADRYLADYDGAEWHFVAFSQYGGGFMKPDVEHAHFINPDNGTNLWLSAEAAGIIITALVLYHRSFMYDRHDEEELYAHFSLRHRQLMTFASSHPEATAIFCALD
ncbi:antirestriction protein [Erwinia amylovora]|uniref:antirestriction protein n=1 Tax=Erwinia amylovora TaxID=552 RepID=UPI0014448905|nr:antirestriction protein [Erwinia amylovora]